MQVWAPRACRRAGSVVDVEGLGRLADAVECKGEAECGCLRVGSGDRKLFDVAEDGGATGMCSSLAATSCSSRPTSVRRWWRSGLMLDVRPSLARAWISRSARSSRARDMSAWNFWRPVLPRLSQ